MPFTLRSIARTVRFCYNLKSNVTTSLNVLGLAQRLKPLCVALGWVLNEFRGQLPSASDRVHRGGLTTSPTWSVGLSSWISPNGGCGLLARQTQSLIDTSFGATPSWTTRT
jgi:hypothetical protein